MTSKTIDDFWIPRLGTKAVSGLDLVKGWKYEAGPITAFKEAPLIQSDQFSDTSSPEDGSIILVSAPGAVGKTTLARQIAARTGAVYVDLASADPVGGNTLSGGLAKSKLFGSWEAGETAALIDGLDEARLRVTQEAFAAFFADIAELSRSRKIPTVIFGRTGSVQDAWLLLADLGIDCPVLEIQYYDAQDAIDFAEARLRVLRPQTQHGEVEKSAIGLLLDRLRNLTEAGGVADNFAGYAPVLQAVADRVLAETNPAGLVAKIEKGEQPITLSKVINAILERERGKLASLKFSDPAISESLYHPHEQLDRLVSKVYDLPSPDLPPMDAGDAQVYAAALDTWVDEHPFLRGPKEASSVVFEGVMLSHALKASDASTIVADQQLARGSAVNPFLAEFYVGSGDADPILHVPLEHVGIVYASMRARLSLGDRASLLIDEGDEEAAVDTVDVEISILKKDGERPKSRNFITNKSGNLRLGAYIEDVSVFVPSSNVEIGPGSEVIVAAPVSIQCQNILFTTSRIAVESTPGRVDGAVFIEASNAQGTQLITMPQIRGEATLRVSWPGARTYPWTGFAAPPAPSSDPRVIEALRRFRKFVVAFRSHSKGSLRRLGAKLEHARMTKGYGQQVLHLLKENKIITEHGPMYQLDPDALGSITGATYRQCMTYDFRDETVAFVSRVIQ